MSSDEPKKGLSVVKKASEMAGDQRITVNRYGFRREYEDYIAAAKVIGCDHQELYDQLELRHGTVFVIYRHHQFSYV